jgi:hypothetical protein
MQSTSFLESLVLKDVQEKTGLTFRKLGGIPTRDRSIAEAILPVLASWVEKLDDRAHRHAIYACFHTPHAYPYLDKLISWWTTEKDDLALSSLTQDLALLVKCGDADHVWSLCQKLPQRPFHYLLLSKLAPCDAVGRQVKDALVRELNTAALRSGDLSYIAQVEDPRIRQWFEGQINAPDPNVRAVAKRVVSRGKPWPEGLAYAQRAPERSQELFSTEADLEDINKLIQKIASDFELRIPSAIKAGAFLASAEVDRWIRVTHIAAKDGEGTSLWFRLEDINTVEVVLLRESPGSSMVQ